MIPASRRQPPVTDEVAWLPITTGHSPSDTGSVVQGSASALVIARCPPLPIAQAGLGLTCRTALLLTLAGPRNPLAQSLYLMAPVSPGCLGVCLPRPTVGQPFRSSFDYRPLLLLLVGRSLDGCLYFAPSESSPVRSTGTPQRQGCYLMAPALGRGVRVTLQLLQIAGRRRRVLR